MTGSGADNTGASNDIDEILSEYGANRALAYRNYGDTPLYSTDAENLKTEAKQAIQNLIAQEATKAQLQIVERILEAGDGTDFVNQMANAVGELAKIYGELTADKESKE